MYACKQFNCVYRSMITDTCDYYLITGQRRQSPAGHCERYVRRESGACSGLNLDSAVSEILMLDLYSSGLGDREIAAELGISAKTVRKWREREALPAQSRLLYAGR